MEESMKSKAQPKRYPIFFKDARSRSRVNQKAAELSVKFGRIFTQQDAIVYLLDQDQIRKATPAEIEIPY
jgi:hypothetical protein